MMITVIISTDKKYSYQPGNMKPVKILYTSHLPGSKALLQEQKAFPFLLYPNIYQQKMAVFINNNLVCAADFQKMGQRGYSTTHLIFGEGGPTKGFLVGEANKGLSYMFQMMNAARIAVGQTAAAVASAAYYNALHYANERPQGRHIADKDLTKEQTLIINHADVRRMLMMQKSIVEGSLSLIVECLKWYDLEKVLEGAEKGKGLSAA